MIIVPIMKSSSRPVSSSESSLSAPLLHRPPSPLPPAAPAASSHPGVADPQIHPHLHASGFPHLQSPTASIRRPTLGVTNPLQHPLTSAASGQCSALDADVSAPLSSGGSSYSTDVASASVSLHPAPFLTKTFDLVDNKDTEAVISWNANGDGFVVWDLRGFCQCLLPQYFRHANFASFIRQLNIYGFRKIDPERLEFANHDFVRGQRHRLSYIHRKKPASIHHHNHQRQYIAGSSHSCVLTSDSEAILEVEKYGIRAELDGLRHKVCALGQHLENSESELQAMSQRLQMSMNCKQHMLAFIAKAMQDPSFLSRHVQLPSSGTLETLKRKRLAGPISESDIRMVDADMASGVCDALIFDQEQASGRPGICESMESKHSMANQSKTELIPYRSRAQNERVKEASLMMATEKYFAENVVAHADRGGPSATAELQSKASKDVCVMPTPSSSGDVPLYEGMRRSECISVFTPAHVGNFELKAQQPFEGHLLHEDVVPWYEPDVEAVNGAVSHVAGSCPDVLCCKEFVDGTALVSSESSASQTTCSDFVSLSFT